MLVLLLLLLGSAACTVIGPNAIYSGRLAYNAAISETNNQQMLMVLVNNRYGETNHLLNIASVTANVSVRSSAGIQAGFGSKSNYEGNLVPFAGGVIYEENPTISYLPVAGEKYFRQISTPIPIDLVARLIATRHDPLFIYNALISSANEVRNPAFLFDDRLPDPGFRQFATLMTELSQNNKVHWYTDYGRGAGFTISTLDASPGQPDTLQPLLSFLDLPITGQNTTRLHIPVVAGFSDAPEGALRVETRSLLELVELMSARVEVPANHLENGLASSFPRAGAFASTFQVRYAPSKPEHAYVSVEHRQGWHYIHEEDQPSKRAFKLLASLWSAAMSNTLERRNSAPLLTVPVSR